MIKKYKICVLLCLSIFSLFACKKSNDENISFKKNVDGIINEVKETNIGKEESIAKVYEKPSFEKFDIGLYDNEIYDNEIYVFKNQNNEQNLSILIKTSDNDCIVIDGGRDSDADFLFDFIKENFNGHVKHWFITHCHDDHIGALYTMLDEHKDDLFIENIYYKFPDVFYAYNVIGEEAGIIALIQNMISKYSQFVLEKNDINLNDANANLSSQSNFQQCIVHDDIKAHDIIKENSIDIEVMNDMYTIDDDLLNNSSMTYKITFKNQNDNNEKKTMLILGDLGYEGGYRLLDDYKDNIEDLKSDICVLSHHGQGGVDKIVYEVINPTYVIWPTTHDIYDNVDKKYHTDDTKKWLDDIKVKKHFTTIDNNILLK